MTTPTLEVTVEQPAISVVTVASTTTPAVTVSSSAGSVLTATSSAGDSLEVLPPVELEITVESGVGARGPQGETGATGALYGGFVYDQYAAMSVWTINHNLGRDPQVSVYDTAGTRIVGFAVTAPDLNTLVLAFSVPLNGTAYLV